MNPGAREWQPPSWAQPSNPPAGQALPPREGSLAAQQGKKKPGMAPRQIDLRGDQPRQVMVGVPPPVNARPGIEPAGQPRQVNLAAPAARQVVLGAEPARQVVLGAEPAKQVVLGAEPAKQVVLGAEPAKQVVLGAEPAKQVVLGAEPAKQVILGAEPAKQVALGAEPAKQVVLGAPEPVPTKAEEDWEKETVPAPTSAPAPKKVDPAPASKKAEPTPTPAPAPKPAPAPVAAAVEEEDEGQVTEEDPRDHLNVVTIGHVDAGKSTLCGAVLVATGVVDKRTIEKYEKEAKERNRESWYLAYIMDTNEEERAKGKTVEVGTANFETEKKRFTILDAPGHKNYVPAMIAGASHADVGVLVISSRKGEFEAGFERQGQTREHAMLAFTIGIRKLIVVINKMDDPSVAWSKERYDEIEKKLTPFLKGCGYKVKKEVIFMPIAALTGAGVLRRITEQESKWATEINENRSLIETLESINIEGRDAAASLRVSVLDSYVDRGVWALGKIEAGTLQRGATVCVSPTDVQAKVGSILIDEANVRTAKPGENICIKLLGLNEESECRKGYVLTDSRIGCKVFTATIKLLELLPHRSIFTAGYTAVLHAHTIISDCVVTKILWKHDAEGKPIKERCTFAKDGEIVTVRLEVPQSIAIESFDVRPQLGRITLRDEGRSVAIGKVKKLEG